MVGPGLEDPAAGLTPQSYESPENGTGVKPGKSNALIPGKRESIFPNTTLYNITIKYTLKQN